MIHRKARRKLILRAKGKGFDFVEATVGDLVQSLALRVTIKRPGLARKALALSMFAIGRHERHVRASCFETCFR